MRERRRKEVREKVYAIGGLRNLSGEPQRRMCAIASPETYLLRFNSTRGLALAQTHAIGTEV